MSLDPFVGEITMFAGNFAPTGWAFCAGQLLPISQNTALFSLLGTYYGGDGKSTFALPNLNGRSPLHVGQSAGPGLQQRFLGEMGGVDSVTLSPGEMPSHNHALHAANASNLPAPSATTRLAPSNGGNIYHEPTHPVVMAANVLQPHSGGQPHNNRQPYVALNYIIALQGIYPPRP